MPTALTPWLRAAGALALFVIAADHLYEYFADHYSAIPTIGPLFLLNGIGATVLGLMLLVPWRALLGDRYSRWMLIAACLGGISLAAGALTGLFVAESRPLFGFMEVGYRTVVVVAIVAEVAAIVVLTALMAVLVQPAQARPRPVPVAVSPGG
jgi:hypothetical protein